MYGRDHHRMEDLFQLRLFLWLGESSPKPSLLNYGYLRMYV